jgi:hypothetical protein
MLQLVVTANVAPRSLILVTLMMEAIRSSETSILQEPHGVTSQKTAPDLCAVIYTVILVIHWTGRRMTGAADLCITAEEIKV